jgi:hypothetical protein
LRLSGVHRLIADCSWEPADPRHRPSSDAIEHPTGAGDIVLRAATRGGFVRLETVMSRLPEFTLYGDGRR